jgi:hypothetical protein
MMVASDDLEHDRMNRVAVMTLAQMVPDRTRASAATRSATARAAVRAALPVVGAICLAAALATPGAAAPTRTADFSTFAPGDSIEGADTVLPGLTIDSSNGDGAAIFDGESPAVYGAPNGNGSGVNGGIGAAGGFADPNGAHDFTFTFDSAIAAFELRVLDFGDFNPGRATAHEFGVRGLDADGNEIASDSRSFTSDGSVNPRSSSVGNLYRTGDAVRAEPGDVGNTILALSAPGMRSVELFYGDSGQAPTDPNIGFTDLHYTPVPLPATLVLTLMGLGALAVGARRA